VESRRKEQVCFCESKINLQLGTVHLDHHCIAMVYLIMDERDIRDVPLDVSSSALKTVFGSSSTGFLQYFDELKNFLATGNLFLTWFGCRTPSTPALMWIVAVSFDMGLGVVCMSQ
jgi:hypothetical protein